MRILGSLALLLLSANAHSQIEVSEFDWEWKSRVDSALVLIEDIDSSRYHFLEDNCNKIQFWIFEFSSIVENGTILVPQGEVKYGSIESISGLIVRESMRLNLCNNLIQMDEETEEIFCRLYELDFLLKVPDIEYDLIEEARGKISDYLENKKPQE